MTAMKAHSKARRTVSGKQTLPTESLRMETWYFRMARVTVSGESYILLSFCKFGAKIIIGVQPGLELTAVRSTDRAMLSLLNHPRRQLETEAQCFSSCTFMQWYPDLNTHTCIVDEERMTGDRLCHIKKQLVEPEEEDSSTHPHH